ncbi:hypothetical protein [Rubrivirga marina]|uniref:Peptidase C-terminal archaeal/bacterial domain-containing protein n=1 Tax=Rubrivirga marina TaxID=1196024 RepID=A0A271IV29_9BACT|nr:hypothetical protein [Rubrivirga marina]PAP75052.1 hypothetical protein BSZ37_00595 [Rubrivirga marina]
MRALLAFALALTTTASAAQSTTSQTFDGRLESGDPTLASGEYFDAYDVDVEAGHLVQVDLVSTAFDPYLLVVRPDGGAWENDDYEGSRTRSYIEEVAPESGVYRVVVTSYAPAETGAYRATVTVGEGGPAPPCGSSVTPYVVTGGAVDTQGRPLAGALVTAHSQSLPGSTVQGTTGSNGCYRLDLLPIPSTWSVVATTDREFGGQTFRFDLHPDAGPLAGNLGAVRSFDWRIAGPRAEGRFYGSPVLVYVPLGITESDVELTLAPVGPLVDGSAGATITRAAVHTGDGWAVADVPIGRYRISARHVPTDGPMEIRRRNAGAYSSEVTLDFEAPFGALSIYWIEVETRLAVGTAGEGGPNEAPEVGLGVWPNPTPVGARATLSLGAASEVVAEVLDALGRRVALLHEGPLAAGSHELQVDASRLPPALYLVRVGTAVGAVTRPLTVAR